MSTNPAKSGQGEPERSDGRTQATEEPTTSSTPPNAEGLERVKEDTLSLAERLRDRASVTGASSSAAMMREAASRLEALQGENERLREGVVFAEGSLHGARLARGEAEFLLALMAACAERSWREWTADVGAEAGETFAAESQASRYRKALEEIDRDALIEIIMRETTDAVTADGLSIGAPNILVQGCRFVRGYAKGYEDPEAAARSFAGFIADALIAHTRKALNPAESQPLGSGVKGE